jgi:hypothetical protein
VHGVLLKNSVVIENFMKTSAPWTDRTGNLRQALYSAVEPPSAAEVVSTIELIISHGLDYSWYVEGYDPRHGYARTRLGNRFSIIEPALDRFGPLIWRDVKRLFR